MAGSKLIWVVNWGARGMGIYYVYLMSSPTGVLYAGMTSDLERRVYEHKYKLIEGFTKKYNVSRLV